MRICIYYQLILLILSRHFRRYQKIQMSGLHCLDFTIYCRQVDKAWCDIRCWYNTI